MNTALLVLRIIPGLLLMGHGLQKLVPPGYSPPLLHAAGHRGTGAGFESLGIRPAVAAAVLAGWPSSPPASRSRPGSSRRSAPFSSAP